MKEYINEVFTLEDSDLTLPDRSRVTNKGDCGRLLVAGGGVGMAGAPSFSAEAAYRSGTGLVEVLTHRDNRIPLQILIPEAVVSFWDEFDTRRLGSYSAAVIGVGMGKGSEARGLLCRLLSSLKCPTVVDADALNIISDTPELLETLGAHTVLTPHVMEFSRLTGNSVDQIKKDPLGLAKAFCQKYKTNLVLKDKISFTVLFDGTAIANTTGDSTLSKGGSGDVLAGLIGSLLAQGMPMERAVPGAVYIHGRAGESAGERLGQRGALARDVIGEIPKVIKEY